MIRCSYCGKVIQGNCTGYQIIENKAIHFDCWTECLLTGQKEKKPNKNIYVNKHIKNYRVIEKEIKKMTGLKRQCLKCGKLIHRFNNYCEKCGGKNE